MNYKKHNIYKHARFFANDKQIRITIHNRDLTLLMMSICKEMLAGIWIDYDDINSCVVTCEEPIHENIKHREVQG